MSHVFISYSRKDNGYVKRLVPMLRENGFDVWIDDHDLRSSEDWWRSIVLAIRSCSALIIVLTPASDASAWVQREITLALKYEKPIYPLWLEGSVDTPNWELFVRTQFHDVRGNKMPDTIFIDALAQNAPRSAGMGRDITSELKPAPRETEGDAVYRDAVANPPRDITRSPRVARIRILPLIALSVLLIGALLIALSFGARSTPSVATSVLTDGPANTSSTPDIASVDDPITGLNQWRASLQPPLALLVVENTLSDLAAEQVSFLFGVAPDELPDIREHRYQGETEIADIALARGYSAPVVMFVEISEQTTPFTTAEIAQILERRWNMDVQGNYTDIGLAQRVNPVTNLQYLVLILGAGDQE